MVYGGVNEAWIGGAVRTPRRKAWRVPERRQTR